MEMSRIGRAYRAGSLVWTNFCVLLVVVNVVAAIYLATREDGLAFGFLFRSPPQFIVEALEISFPELDAEQRAALWRESGIPFRPDPITGFREKAVTGEYVTVDEAGFRRGKEQGPWPPSGDAYNVFLLGGSTAFGYGVPDEQTISSYLQEVLPAVDGREPRVYNFARGGFTSTMERLLFEKLILVEPRPDLVIFLDGVNDFGQPGDPVLVQRYLTRRTDEALERPWLGALRSLPLVRTLAGDDWTNIGLADLPRDQSERLAADDSDRLDAVIARYVSNVQAIRGIASAHGVDVFFVWQPAPVYKYDLSYHTHKSQRFGGHERSRHGFPRMRAYVDAHPMGDDFTWCADIQEDAKELLYVDRMHYNPKMSTMVARCIADGLVDGGLPQ